MPPKANPRKRAHDEDVIPSRVSTSYGSDISLRRRDPTRGKARSTRRTIGSIHENAAETNDTASSPPRDTHASSGPVEFNPTPASASSSPATSKHAGSSPKRPRIEAEQTSRPLSPESQQFSSDFAPDHDPAPDLGLGAESDGEIDLVVMPDDVSDPESDTRPTQDDHHPVPSHEPDAEPSTPPNAATDTAHEPGSTTEKDSTPSHMRKRARSLDQEEAGESRLRPERELAHKTEPAHKKPRKAISPPESRPPPPTRTSHSGEALATPRPGPRRPPRSARLLRRDPIRNPIRSSSQPLAQPQRANSQLQNHTSAARASIEEPVGPVTNSKDVEMADQPTLQPALESPESTRSFGDESSLFGGAALNASTPGGTIHATPVHSSQNLVQGRPTTELTSQAPAPAASPAPSPAHFTISRPIPLGAPTSSTGSGRITRQPTPFPYQQPAAEEEEDDQDTEDGQEKQTNEDQPVQHERERLKEITSRLRNQRRRQALSENRIMNTAVGRRDGRATTADASPGLLATKAVIPNHDDLENEPQENGVPRPWQRGGGLQRTPPDDTSPIRAQVAQYLPFVGNSHPDVESDSEPDTPAEPEIPRRFSYRTAIRRWLLRMLGRFLDVLDYIIEGKYSPILLGLVVVTMAYFGGAMLSKYMSQDSWSAESYNVFSDNTDSGPSKAFPTLSLNWYGWDLSAWSWNLAQLVPLWLARPSTIFSGDDAVEYQRRLREVEFELQQLRASTSFHRSSLDKLTNIVPAVVYMELDRNNRPVVNEAFYHALRDLMKEDREMVTLQRGTHGYYDVSDETWMAVKTRLAREKHLLAANQTVKPAPSLSRGEIDRLVESQVPKSWADWARKNRDKVAEVLGPVLHPAAAAPLSSEDVMKKVTADVEKQLEKSAIQYANDAIRKASGGGALLTRGEFLSHLKSEFLTYRNEIRAETEGILKSNLTSYIHDMLERATNYHPGEGRPSSSPTAAATGSGGITRGEVLQIVDAEIRNAVSRAGLRAFAEGKISATWDHDLQQRVNYFARGNGAVIDATHTSPNFAVTGTGHYDDHMSGDSGGKKSWIRSSAHSLRSPRVMQPYVALLDWRNAGECWCGSLTQTRFNLPYGVSLSIALGHRVIPEYIVVEHILPGATVYPDARPRDIEVWAYIDDDARRQVAQDFSRTHFAPSRPFREEGWVKIGQFEYESREATNGAYVHRLNPALQEMRIETDHIILRATSNYGQKDHTCFYRVRMYGEAVKGLPLKST